MRYILVLATMLFSTSVFAQSASNVMNEENYEYMPRINDLKLSGSIKQKFTAYKNGNPVNFIVVKKKNITVWDVAFFDKLKVGDKIDLEGIVPLTWVPDKTAPINGQSRTVVAKSVDR